MDLISLDKIIFKVNVSISLIFQVMWYVETPYNNILMYYSELFNRKNEIKDI